MKWLFIKQWVKIVDLISEDADVFGKRPRTNIIPVICQWTKRCQYF